MELRSRSWLTPSACSKSCSIHEVQLYCHPVRRSRLWSLTKASRRARNPVGYKRTGGEILRLQTLLACHATSVSSSQHPISASFPKRLADPIQTSQFAARANQLHQLHRRFLTLVPLDDFMRCIFREQK